MGESRLVLPRGTGESTRSGWLTDTLGKRKDTGGGKALAEANSQKQEEEEL